MKKLSRNILLLNTLLFAFLYQHAQVLDVSATNMGNNVIRITGTATAPGFDVPPNNSWASMNLTWRIPKTAAVPAPTVAPPAITPEITGETTAFTGASPRDLFNNTGLDLTMFDLTTFGETDDGYWYFQVTGTTGAVQSISTGSTVILYEFKAPTSWTCPSCVEILTSQVPGFPMSTISFIDNGGMGQDVLNLVSTNVSLPANFLSFEADKTGDDVQLIWKMSNEENVNGYYVERSANSLSWETIGFKAFQPISSGINTYGLTDQNPLAGINYYRIRQQDIDGRIKYSVIRTIRMDVNSMQVYLYPVPAKNVLKVNIQSTINGPGMIKITDVLGRTIRYSGIQLRKGGQTEEIPVSNMRTGTYFIEIQSSGYKWSTKFIKE